MLKKVSLCLMMSAVLFLGTSQLYAVEILDGLGCCPATYNGAAFQLAVDWGSRVDCWYDGAKTTCNW